MKIMKQVKTIDILNPDCLGKIFLHLQPDEKNKINKVCKKWSFANKFAWNKIKTLNSCDRKLFQYFVSNEISQFDVNEMLKRCGDSLEVLTLTNNCDSTIMTAVSKHCVNLKKLVLILKDYHPDNFKTAFSKMTKLESIDIKKLDDTWLKNIASHDNVFQSVTSNIKEISLHANYDKWLFFTDNFTSTLGRFDELVSIKLEKCLKILECEGCKDITDVGIMRVVLQNYKKLERLGLAQKQSAGCWKIIKIYTVPLTFIVMNIAIYCAYKRKTNHRFWEELHMWFAARDETLQYSIIPSKTITSSVLFDDSKINIFKKGGSKLLVNDNTRNLILSKELDENIEKPFPRGEPMPIKIAQKQSAGCWKIIKIYSLPFIVMNIGIYCVYKIKRDNEFWERVDMRIAAMEETLKYSIIPSKIITSSVLFDDSSIEIFKEKYLSLINDNTRNLILSKELDANIQEPFPRGEPVPIKIGGVNGLLDNGKLTLKTGDSDTTFTFHNTLILEVTKTSTTLQDAKKYELLKQKRIGKFNVLIPAYKITKKTSKDEKTLLTTTVDRSNSSLKFEDIFPITGNFSFSFEAIVKIQPDDSDEVYHLIHNVKIECDKKVDENLKNMIATKEVSPKDMVTEGTNVTVDCGTVVFKTQDGEKVYWKDLHMWFAARNETLKYSIIPSKIITFGVLFDDSGMKIESQEDNLTLVNDNTRNLILSKELYEHIEKPFPRGKPMPIKIGNFNGLLDNGKLTLTTQDGDTTYTFHYTLSLKVEKSSTTLQNKIDAIKKNQRETIPTKIGKFNVLMPGSKLTLKTPESENTWTGIVLDLDIEGYNLENYTRPDSVSSSNKFPVIGNFNHISHTKVKIQADDSDEVFYFKQNVNFEYDRKLNENLQNIINTKELTTEDMLSGATCVHFDSGAVVFKYY
ncbi:hypothetical protein HCN44_007980 [Aphidius gifuensis]|uniref:F-box domain-containing protein n=1 Tax=Aphidius gifuensis TaxID=684658 RepID=A0A834XM72_APHGI|nr:hypothetical protein HCN44_007980 [Aphidius gifuensis]